MAFALKIAVTKSQCAVATVILLLAVHVCFIPTTAQNSTAQHRACQLNNSVGICVRREQCINGTSNTKGIGSIDSRMLYEMYFDSCNISNEECCRIPEDILNDSGEVTTTTTEKPDWSGECGQRTDVVKNDKENVVTSRFEFPWSVALFSVETVYDKEQKQFLCGGTLIDDFSVLTAAQCVHQQNRNRLVVQLGRWNLDDNRESQTQEIAVEKVSVHRDYVSSSQINNIAILYLEEPVNMGRAVNRVCLPDHSVPFDKDSLCSVVGWSNRPPQDASNRQLKIRSTFATPKKCTDSIRRVTGSLHFQLPKESICPEYLDDPVLCERAPGSGMVCESKTSPGQFFLVGIASYSVRDCQRFNVPDVFVKITDYIGWIDDRVRVEGRAITGPI